MILGDETTDAIARRFLLDGFVVLPNTITPDATREALNLCERTAARRNRVRAPVPYELLHRSPLNEIARSKQAQAMLVRLLGEHYATQDICWFRISPPGGSAIDRIHRDRPACDGLPLSVSVDAMLTDFTEQNGATQIWSGTQHSRAGEPRAANEDAARFLTATPPTAIVGTAGSIVLRDERAWHRAGVNRTAVNRCMFSSPGWRSVEARTAVGPLRRRRARPA